MLTGLPTIVFTAPFPSRGIVTTKIVHETKESAYQEAVETVKAWEKSAWWSNMGTALGVTRKDNGWVGVYVLYYSNS